MWYVINAKTNKIVDTWRTEQNASILCEELNKHEIQNQREPVFLISNHPPPKGVETTPPPEEEGETTTENQQDA